MDECIIRQDIWQSGCIVDDIAKLPKPVKEAVSRARYLALCKSSSTQAKQLARYISTGKDRKTVGSLYLKKLDGAYVIQYYADEIIYLYNGPQKPEYDGHPVRAQINVSSLSYSTFRNINNICAELDIKCYMRKHQGRASCLTLIPGDEPTTSYREATKCVTAI